MPPTPPATPPATPPVTCASPLLKKASFSSTVSYSPTPQPLAPTGDELPPMPLLPRAISAPFSQFRAPEDLSFLRVQPGCWSPTPQRRASSNERMRRFSDLAVSPPRHSQVDESKRIRRGSKILMPGIDPRKEDQTPWFG